MKITQNLLLIFLFLFITNDLFAGLGTTTWGPGGIKRNVEVNEIEEIESEALNKNKLKRLLKNLYVEASEVE